MFKWFDWFDWKTHNKTAPARPLAEIFNFLIKPVFRFLATTQLSVHDPHQLGSDHPLPTKQDMCREQYHP